MLYSQIFKSLLADQTGATAIEYGLIATLIGIAIIGGIGSLANSIGGTLSGVNQDVTTAFNKD